MLELTVVDADHRRHVLKFEHSLRSLSKWEAKYRKPYLVPQHTAYEMVDYYREMLLGDSDPTVIYRLSPEQLEMVEKYINTPQTASSVPKEGRPSTEQVTSELIYYWMTELGIDWEAQDWHLSRLMMLIQITTYKKQAPKKQRVSDFKESWASANAAAKKKYNSNG